MSQSEQINELVSALSKAQGQMRLAAADRSNPHFKSKYASLASTLETIREPLANHGLAVIQTFDSQAADPIVVTTLAHSSGQWISSRLTVLCAQKTNHALGSGITYAKRYSLAAIVGVASGDEDDDGNKSVEKGLPPVEFVSAEEHAEFKEMLDKCDEKFVKNMFVWAAQKFTSDQMNPLKKYMGKFIEKQTQPTGENDKT